MISSLGDMTRSGDSGKRDSVVTPFKDGVQAILNTMSSNNANPTQATPQANYATQGVPVPTIGNQPGQCPLDENGNPDIKYRECDAYTGNTHWQYTLPGGQTPNANILNYNPQTGQYNYTGATGAVLVTNVKPVVADNSLNQLPTDVVVKASNPVIPSYPANTTPNTNTSTSVTPNQTQQGNNPDYNSWMKDALANLQSLFSSTFAELSKYKSASNTATQSTNAASQSSTSGTATKQTSGPGISYNDINPDGTAVQSSAGGLLTDMFAALDAGVSIAGVNVPLWLLVATGLGGVYLFRGKGNSEGRRFR